MKVVFRLSGGLALIYEDLPESMEVEVEDGEATLARAVALCPVNPLIIKGAAWGERYLRPDDPLPEPINGGPLELTLLSHASGG